MELTILKGAREIGGNCVALTEAGFTLLLDLGQPLDPDSKPASLAGVSPDAVLVSHSHQDHYGAIEEKLGPKVPVHIGAVSLRLIEAARVFMGLPRLKNNFHAFDAWSPFKIGPFSVRPFLMDHSSPEAFAFLIEAGGRRLLYSGDFRAHGRKGKLFERLLREAPPGVDALVMEGTMLGRGDQDQPTEHAVEERLRKIFTDSKRAAFVICSGQNLDRVVSIFRACQGTGRTMVLDPYGAWVLRQMLPVSRGLPQLEWEGVKVYVLKRQYDAIAANREIFGDFSKSIFDPGNRLKLDQIMAAPGDYVFVARPSLLWLMRRLVGQGGIDLVYSQWTGYLKEGPRRTFSSTAIAKLRDDPRVRFHYAHTSGHAFVKDLVRLTQALRPLRVIPVHTERAEEFGEHFENVLELEENRPCVL